MLQAWLAHLYTASGALLAFLAATETFSGNYRAALFWLTAQVIVDATDGAFARHARVSERLPWFNGAKLDDLIDYICYVFVPALIIWRALLVPDALAVPIAAAMLISSAYGFNREDAKTSDHFFTGFPSYWNVVVAYMLFGGWSPATNAVILLTLALLVFVPIRYIYPSRTPVFRLSMNIAASLWGISMMVMLWQYPQVSHAWFLGSFVFPVYYTVVSLLLHYGVLKRASLSAHAAHQE